jgi:RsiW-degrading membrane proteinase PrsW (M82 family)
MRVSKTLLFVVVPLCAIWIFCVNVFVPNPSETPEHATFLLENDKNPEILAKAYVILLQNDPHNFENIYGLVHNYANATDREQRLLIPSLKKVGYNIPDELTHRAQSASTAQRDEAHFALAVWRLALEKQNPTWATDGKLYLESCAHLDSISDAPHRFLAHFQALSHYANYNFDSAKEALELEIEQFGPSPESTRFLARIAYQTQDFSAFTQLLTDPASESIIPSYQQRDFYLHEGKYGSYLLSMAKDVVYKSSLPTLIGVLAIFFTWLFFLLRVNIFKAFPWKRAVIVVLASALLTTFCGALYELLGRTGFDFNGDIFNDLAYSIFGIGVIEETVKILPLLLIYTFRRKWLQTPMDYLTIAALSGLAFASIENLGYFDRYGIEIIHVRGILTSVAHMFYTVLVAYGIILYKFRPKTSKYQIVLFAGIAIAVHGLYDFFLISWVSQYYAPVSIVIWFVGLYAFSSILNNALNNSPTFNHLKSKKLDNVNAILLVGLTTVFLIEITFKAMWFGADTANDHALDLFITSYFALPLIALALNKIDLVQNYWEPINIHGVKRIFRLGELYGSTVSIKPFKKDHPLFKQFPCTGKVKCRKIIDGDPNWFEIELDTPIACGGFSVNLALAKPKLDNEVYSEEPILSHFQLVLPEAIKSTGWVYAEIIEAE